jgi:hypothetical protein
MKSAATQSPLFLVFILFSGIIVSLQILLNLTLEIVKLAGKASVFLPTLPPAQVAMSMGWLGICSVAQYWWLTVV